MKTAILILSATMAACTASEPAKSTDSQSLCTIEDDSTGNCYVNPYLASVDWTTSTYQNSNVLGTSCFSTYNTDDSWQGYQCHVLFSWYGVTYDASCAVWSDGSVDCGVD